MMLKLKIPYEMMGGGYVLEGKGDPQFDKIPSCSSCNLNYKNK